MKDKMFLPACVIAIFAGSFIGGSITDAVYFKMQEKKRKEVMWKNIEGMAKVLEELEEA